MSHKDAKRQRQIQKFLEKEVPKGKQTDALSSLKDLLEDLAQQRSPAGGAAQPDSPGAPLSFEEYLNKQQAEQQRQLQQWQQQQEQQAREHKDWFRQQQQQEQDRQDAIAAQIIEECNTLEEMAVRFHVELPGDRWCRLLWPEVELLEDGTSVCHTDARKHWCPWCKDIPF